MTKPHGILAAIERTASLTPTGVAALAFAFLGWLAGYATGSVAMTMLSYGAAALVAALWLASLRAPPVTATRSSLPGRIRERQTVSVELEITATRRTTSLVLEDVLPPRLGAPPRVLLATAHHGEPVRHRYTVTPSLRGVYAIGPLQAITTDPFGFTRRRHTIVAPEQVLVHPSTEMVHDRVLSREWEDPPIRPPISKPWPTGFEFYGMRQYVPGDDPRRIVWRAFLRTGEVLVREAEQGITDRVLIVLDDDARVHTQSDPSDTFETAIRAAASLASKHLRDGFSVSVETSNARLTPAVRGTTARMLVLDGLARATLHREPLGNALRRMVSEPRRDAHTILVAPRLAGEAVRLLGLLLARGGSATFVHIAGEEPDPASRAAAASLGCEIIELAAGDALEKVFRRGVGAGLR